MGTKHARRGPYSHSAYGGRVVLVYCWGEDRPEGFPWGSIIWSGGMR